MKKVTVSLICLLFALTMLYPVGLLIKLCFGYYFELISVSAFAIVLGILSVCVAVLDIISETTLENYRLKVLSAILVPVSCINAFLYILDCPKIWVLAGVWSTIGCCCFLAAKYGKPLAVQITSIALSSLMFLPLAVFSFFALTFGRIGQNTVVRTVESPGGKYYAQVIDSDQGALGGNTFVDVYQRGEINALLFKIRKAPQRIYSGDWGEFEYMQVQWKDDSCLIIRSVEYEIESGEQPDN